MLEDEQGGEDLVDADRLMEHGFPEEAWPETVVLAGCSTSVDLGPSAAPQAEESLPAIGRRLAERGVASVIAMQAPVSDAYATELAGALFVNMSVEPTPGPIRALATARRTVELDRRASGERRPPEWATPVVFSGRSGVPRLHDLAGPDVGSGAEPDTTLVGRRRERRQLHRTLRDGDRAGTLIHGIGGIGKSALARELVRAAEGDTVVVTVIGRCDPATILDRIGARLLAHESTIGSIDAGRRDTLRGLRQPGPDWRQRLRSCVEEVLTRGPVVLLLDNFEDNLTPAGHFRDEELIEFLVSWSTIGGTGPLLITSRRPPELPAGVELPLETVHLGPLSLAEATKLTWRYRGLAALSRADLLRLHAAVGGHPRSLELADAVLRGGDAPESLLTHIEEHLGVATEHRAAWYEERRNHLDAALAVSTAVASRDVLLDRLWEQLATVPMARELLAGAAVYRRPVDDDGLRWQVAPPPILPLPLELVDVMDQLTTGLRHQVSLTPEAHGWSPDLIGMMEERMRRDAATFPGVPPDYPAALAVLTDLGLVAPATVEDGSGGWIVHRWLERPILSRVDPSDEREAHYRASGYWVWRGNFTLDRPVQALRLLHEVLYHALHTELDDLVLNSALEALQRLERAGDPAGARSVIGDMLDHFAAGTTEHADWLVKLARHDRRAGNVAGALRHLDEAEHTYRPLDHPVGLATVHSARGTLLVEIGNLAHAEAELGEALRLFQGLEHADGELNARGQLAIVAIKRRDFALAKRHGERVIGLSRALGRTDAESAQLHNLGFIALWHDDLDEAERLFHRSLEIDRADGNRPGVAASYHQLAMVAQHRGDLAEAERCLREAIDGHDDGHDLGGLARAHHQMGRVLHSRGALDDATKWYRGALTLADQLELRELCCQSSAMLGQALHELGRPIEAVEMLLVAVALAAEAGVDGLREQCLLLTAGVRDDLGADRFGSIVGRHLDDDQVVQLQLVLDGAPRTPSLVERTVSAAVNGVSSSIRRLSDRR